MPVHMGETTHNAVLNSEEVLWRNCRIFKCQRKLRKQFSTLWWPFEVGASLFMCVKDLITPF